MDDQVLIRILETACAEEQLIFQVVEQDRHLHIFLNREPEQVLNYRTVGKKIYQAFSRLSLTDIDGVCLYSRILGEEEPDWEANFRLPQAKQTKPASQAKQPVQAAASDQSATQRQMSEADTYIMQDAETQRAEAPTSRAEEGLVQAAVPQRSATAVATPVAEAANYPLSDPDGAVEAAVAYEAAEAAAPTVSVMAEMPPARTTRASDAVASPPPLEDDFDLREHCFIRNRMLLTADILPPSKAVAQQIKDFHGFSMAEKQHMVPQIELFFKGAPTFTAEALNDAQQSWFQGMEALTGDDTRKAPIWLSRYCLDAAATLEVVARVFDPSLGAPQDEAPEEALEETSNAEIDSPVPQGGAAHSISGSISDSMMGGMATAPARSRQQSARSSGPNSTRAKTSPSQPLTSDQPSTTQSAPKSPFPPGFFPSIVVFGSLLMILLGLVFAKPATVTASHLCNGSSSPEQCQLATQIVDSDFIEEIAAEAKPLPTDPWEQESLMDQAAANCNSFAAMNAGENLIQAFEGAPAPINSSATEVMPGIVLADVEQANLDDPGSGNVRTACVLQYATFESLPGAPSELMPVDHMVIPTAWPAESFESGEGYAEQVRLARANNIFVRMGSTLIFTAVGMFAAVMLRTAITVYSVDVLCQATIVMCIIEVLMDLIAPFGILRTFAAKSLALGLTSAIVPNFKLNWSNGYYSVLACVMVMSFVRLILGWFLFAAIFQGNAM